jgi:hypothetical protein
MNHDPDAPTRPPPRRALLIVNPKARNGSAPLDRAISRFEAARVAKRVETSASPGEVGAEIRRLAP